MLFWLGGIVLPVISLLNFLPAAASGSCLKAAPCTIHYSSPSKLPSPDHLGEVRCTSQSWVKVPLEQESPIPKSWPSAGSWAIQNWATEVGDECMRTCSSPLAWAASECMYACSVCASSGCMCPQLMQMELQACACAFWLLARNHPLSLPLRQSAKPERLGNFALASTPALNKRTPRHQPTY